MSHVVRVPGVLAIALLLALWAAPTLAQEASPASDTEVARLEGIEQAIGRQYATDLETLQPSPAANAPSGDSVFFVTARIVTFDTSDHADAAYTMMRQDVMQQYEALGLAGTPQVTEENLDGLGDGAHAITLESTRDGTTGYLRVLLVRDGQALYVLSAIAGTADGAAITDDIAQDMLSRDTGDADAAFNADGTSTGGLWEKLPDTGDPVLRGMTVVQDQQLVAPSS